MGLTFDVILLDVDGTLLDFDAAEERGMQVVLSAYGFKPEPGLTPAGIIPGAGPGRRGSG